jgi:hypothetical protein
MMPKFVRAAGLRIRRYVLPLVGYWDLVAQLGELHARLGQIEVGLAGRLGEIEVGLGGRLGEIETLIAARLGEIETLSAARLTATEKRLMEVVGAEVERLDGYLVHHMLTLRADIGRASTRSKG